MENIKPAEAKDRIILALDFDNIEDVIKHVDLLKEYVGYFKVGLPLIISCGFEFDFDTYRASIYRVVEESRHASRIRWQAQFLLVLHTTFLQLKTIMPF